MKKSKGFTMMTSFILGAALLFPMVSCGGSENSPSHSDSLSQSSTSVPSSTDSSEIDLEDYDLTTFELGKYTAPIWEGQVSYAEGVFVKENAEGQTEPIPLLYPIDKIISVRSADLSVKYEEGKDYEVTEAGTLRILDGGKIPVLPYEQYYFETYTDDGLQTQIPASTPTGAYIVAETTRIIPECRLGAWLSHIRIRKTALFLFRNLKASTFPGSTKSFPVEKILKQYFMGTVSLTGGDLPPLRKSIAPRIVQNTATLRWIISKINTGLKFSELICQKAEKPANGACNTQII